MIKYILHHPKFEKTIFYLILVNAFIIGLENLQVLSSSTKNILSLLDSFLLVIFTCEILLKLLHYKTKFFKDPWRVFDFLIVGISLIPAVGPLSILRSLRVLRTLRMISSIPKLRLVVNGLLRAIPGLGAVMSLMGLVYYVSAILAKNFFGEAFPHWFGTLGQSSYTLFQIMTLESWSMGIVRPVMEKYSYSWLFFLPFILITTFTMLNLFIAVIVTAIQNNDSDLNPENIENEKNYQNILIELKQVKKILYEKESKSIQFESRDRTCKQESRL